MATPMARKGPPALAMVVSPVHHDEPDGDEGGDDEDKAKMDAMSAFISAVKGGKAEDALAAFGALHDLHCGGEDEEGEGEDGGEAA